MLFIQYEYNENRNTVLLLVNTIEVDSVLIYVIALVTHGFSLHVHICHIMSAESAPMGSDNVIYGKSRNIITMKA